MIPRQCLVHRRHFKKLLDGCLLICFPIKLDSGLYKTKRRIFLQWTGKRSLTGTVGKGLSKLRAQPGQEVAEPTAS